MSDSTQKHSPLPWRIEYEPSPLGDGQDYTVWDANGQFLMNDTGYYPSALSPDDAEFVVATVNARAALSSEAGQGEARKHTLDCYFVTSYRSDAYCTCGAAQPKPEPSDDVALIVELRKHAADSEAIQCDEGRPRLARKAADAIERLAKERDALFEELTNARVEIGRYRNETEAALAKAQAAVPVKWARIIFEIDHYLKSGYSAPKRALERWKDDLTAALPTPSDGLLRKAFEAGLTYAANVKVTDVDQAWRDVAAALAEQETKP